MVCKQLGYPAANASKSGSFFGESSGQFMLDEVSCQGKEKGVEMCEHGPWKNASDSCNPSKNAGVICTSGFLFSDCIVQTYNKLKNLDMLLLKHFCEDQSSHLVFLNNMHK